MITNVNIITNRDDPQDDNCIFAVSFQDMKVMVFNIPKIDMMMYIQYLQSLTGDPDALMMLTRQLKMKGLKEKNDNRN